MFLTLTLIYLFALNGIAYLAFRADKRRSTAGLWRMPESRLLLIAYAGGWFGAKAGQIRYRHKTRKEPFRSVLNAVPLAWGAVALAFALRLEVLPPPGMAGLEPPPPLPGQATAPAPQPRLR